MNPSTHPIDWDGDGDSASDGVDAASDDGDGPSNAGGINPPLLDRGQGENR